MGFALHDKWLWDSWYARDGDLWHGFFLQADKSIGDPEQRHWNVSYHHATSRDLTNWDSLGTCFAPAASPAWDDFTTWTGSVVRGDDGAWHLFYTGTSRADRGKKQRLGHAVSSDLHIWERVGDGMILDLAAPYEDYIVSRWHDRAFRDPFVMRDPDGDGWLMYFTARDASERTQLEAGAIGFATSPDLFDWTLQDPIFTGAFGELEVPQVFEWGDTWYCLFCTAGRFWSEGSQNLLGAPKTGTHYLMADTVRGPWTVAPGPLLDADHDGQRYAARIVGTGNDKNLLGFLMTDPATGTFPGIIADPTPVVRLEDGRLALEENM